MKRLPNIAIIRLPAEYPPATWGDESVVAQVADVLTGAGLSVHVHEISSVDEACAASAAADLVIPNGRYFQASPGESRLFTELLDTWEVPYLGSGPTGQSASVKSWMKSQLTRNGVQTPHYRVFSGTAEPSDLAFPLVAKPDRSCESIGVVRVNDQEQLNKAVTRIQADYGQPAVVEEWHRAREYTVAVVGNGPGRQYMPVEINVPPGVQFLDEELKLHFPERQLDSVADEGTRDRLTELSSAACIALDIRDWARIDVVEGESGQLYIIDVNTMPGLVTDPEQPSFLPICLYRNRGLNWAESVLAVVGSGILRLNLKFPPAMEGAGAKLGLRRSS